MTSCACTEDTNISVYKNRDRTIRATITGPGDLTGAKIWFSVKSARDDSDADAVITKKSLNNGGGDDQAEVIDGPNGIIEIYLKPSDTVNLGATEYWFDIVIETAAGRKMEAVGPSVLKLLQPVTVA